MDTKKLSSENEPGNNANTVLPAVFNLSKYLKSKGFKRLNRNQSHPADCTHKYKFIHPDSIIRIVMWDDELMSVGNNPSEFEIPESENEFLTILKDVEPAMFAFLNSR